MTNLFKSNLNIKIVRSNSATFILFMELNDGDYKQRYQEGLQYFKPELPDMLSKIITPGEMCEVLNQLENLEIAETILIKSKFKKEMK